MSAPWSFNASHRTRGATTPGSEIRHICYEGNDYSNDLDKDKPLDGLELDKRVSLLLGMTLSKIEDKERTAEGVVGGKGAMLGLGLRLTDYVRIGAGAIFLRQNDPNPNSDQNRVVLTPFTSASLDLDVYGTLKDSFKKAE